MKKREPPACHQAGRGETDQQQQTDSAFHAARGMHQQCHRDNVEHNLPGQMVGRCGKAPMRHSHRCRRCNEIKYQRPSGQHRCLRAQYLEALKAPIH